MLRLTLRSLWAHKVRLLLTLLAVTLGVAFVTAAFVLTDSLTKTFDQIGQDIAGPIDLEVRSDDYDNQSFDQPPIPLDIVDVARANPAVEAATPDVQGVVYAQDKAGEDIGGGFSPPNLSSVYADGQVGPFELATGEAPGAGEVLVDEDTADEFDFAIGDGIQIASPHTAREEFVLSGIVRLATENAAPPRFFLFELSDAQRLIGFNEDQVTVIDMRLVPDADPIAVRAELEPLLPPDTEILTSEELASDFADAFGEILNIFRGVLLGFAAVALIVSIFVIANTFAIVLGQRIRELGLLRAIGANGRQVTWSVLAEAVIVGVLASAVGFGIGVGVASLGIQAFNGSGDSTTEIILTPRTLVVALIVGLVVTLISALLPAIRAGRIPPIAALREGVATRPKRRAGFIVGVVLGAIAAVAIFAGMATFMRETAANVMLIGLGAVLVLVAGVLISPTLVPRLVRILASPQAAVVAQVLAVGLVVLGIVTAVRGVADMSQDTLDTLRDQFGNENTSDATLKGYAVGGALFSVALLGGGLALIAQPFMSFTVRTPRFNKWYWRTFRVIGVIITVVVVIASLGQTFTAFGLAVPILLAAAVLFLAGRSGIGIPGKIARASAVTNRHRTATTAASLMIGLALIATTLVVAESIKRSLSNTLSDSVQADLFVYDETFTGFAPGLAEEIRGTDNVAQLASYRAAQAEVVSEDDRKVPLFATDREGLDGLIDVGIIDGSIDGLDDNAILVQKDPAEELGLEVGDPVSLAFTGTSNVAELTVGGIFEDAAIAGNWIVGLDTFNANALPSLKRDTFVAIRLEDDSEQALRATQARLETIAEDYPGVVVQDRNEFTDSQEGFLDQALVIINVFLTMAIIIAIIGIANTVALSVFERTHELGLLRAVGMNKWQLRQMIRWESVAIAVFGAVLGIAMGCLFGYAIVAVLPDSFVNTWAFPWTQLLAVLIVAAVAGMGAAYWPSRRAGNLNVLDAIAHE